MKARNLVKVNIVTNFGTYFYVHLGTWVDIGNISLLEDEKI
jgi:hypothetical protein